jgi:hypothetical protein
MQNECHCLNHILPPIKTADRKLRALEVTSFLYRFVNLNYTTDRFYLGAVAPPGTKKVDAKSQTLTKTLN